jgi:hypothetical protein
MKCRADIDGPRLHRIDPSKLFCNTLVKERCVNQIDRKTLYFDDDYLSIEGADLVVQDIMKGVHIPH